MTNFCVLIASRSPLTNLGCRYVFDHLGAAVAPLLFCGTVAADGTVLDMLLKIAASPEMGCVREAVHACAVHLVSIAPSPKVLKVVLRVGLKKESAAKTCACAAALLGIIVQAVPLRGQVQTDVGKCLVRSLTNKDPDVRQEGAAALKYFAAAGYTTQAHTIIEDVKANNRTFGDKLSEQIN